MQVIKNSGHALIKLWTDGVPIEEEALKQVNNVASMPFVTGVAIMPDVHWGMGATIGSVIATRGAIIPASVGVDIGCGMMAVKTSLTASQLPENLFDLRCAIEAAVPHGRTDNGGKNDRGAWCNLPLQNIRIFESIMTGYHKILLKHPKVEPQKIPAHHLGTLGTGNHFIEICLDESNNVWVMLHSGSRGIGNKIGTYFIEKAKEEMRRYYIDKFIPDIDLAYLVEKTELYDDYFFAVDWAQNYAKLNRELMMSSVINAMTGSLGILFSYDLMAINCHHNYVERENHFESNVLVTRKGAVRARVTDYGIIPGSMGAKSFIVKGKGNSDSFQSCSHGAGRIMSRNQAKKQFTLADHELATRGVECRKDTDVIDETPAAYKSIEAVMAAQSDLVDIVHTLKQIVCVKG